MNSYLQWDEIHLLKDVVYDWDFGPVNFWYRGEKGKFTRPGAVPVDDGHDTVRKSSRPLCHGDS